MRPSVTPADTPRARKRARTEEPTTSGARWLTIADPLSLLAKASAPPWHGACVDGAYSTHPVAWEHVEAGDHWDHEVIWLPCSKGAAAAAIHRFSPRDVEVMSSLLGELHGQARAEMAAGECLDQASNVGGFHGERDLFSREQVLEGALPWLVGGAVQQAAQAEAAELGRAPIATSADEAWFNALGPGGWNVLHTHPGTTYSGALFVAKGGRCCDHDDGRDDRLAGRLVFVGDAPSLKQGRHDEQNRAPHLRRTARTAAAAAATAGAAERRFLLVDPTPGTCVVFPSFVPHFVLPTAPARPGGGDEGCGSGNSDGGGGGGGGGEAPALRLSVAFNFGACDPVVAHAFVQPGRHGARVKLVLETVDLFGA